MRKPSYKDLETMFDSASRERDALRTVVGCIFNADGIDAQETVRLPDGTKYTLSLYGATRPDGGTVVVAFDAPGNKRISVEAKLLDQLHYPVGAEWLPLAVAAERLTIARNRLCEEAA